MKPVNVVVRHPDIKRMGYRVAEARDKLGFTQEKLAELISSSREEVNRMENGSRFLFKKILELSDALGVTADYILTGKGGPVRYRIKKRM